MGWIVGLSPSLSLGQVAGVPAEAFRKGDVTYTVEWPGDPQGQFQERRLTWTKDALREEIRIKGWTIVTYLVNGQLFTFPTDENRVEFNKEARTDLPGDPNKTVAAQAASIPLGGVLPGFTFTRDAQGRIVSAYMKKPGYVALNWTFTSQVSAGPGLSVPRISTLKVLDTTQVFTILSAKLGDAIEVGDLRPKWYAPGVAIGDSRVSPPVGWTYEELVQASGKKEGLTPAELLEISKARAAYFARSAAKQQSRERQRNQSRALTWLVPLGVFILVAGGGFLAQWLQRRSRS